MRQAAIFGYRVGKKEAETICGPHVPIVTQEAKFKQLALNTVSDIWSSVEFWNSSGGRSRTLKFRTPDAIKASEERIKAEERKIAESKAKEAAKKEVTSSKEPKK